MNNKKIALNLLPIIISLLIVGCKSSQSSFESDPHTESFLNGKWESTFSQTIYENGQNVKCTSQTVIVLNAEDHHFSQSININLDEPIVIKNSIRGSVEGTWRANKEYLESIGDESTAIVRINPAFSDVLSPEEMREDKEDLLNDLIGRDVVKIEIVDENTIIYDESHEFHRISEYKESGGGKNNVDSYAEIIFPDGRVYILNNDNTVTEDGNVNIQMDWGKEGGVIVIFTGEGTSYWTIIDGYLYDGRYENGKCWNEEWDDEAGCLYDVGYIPIPSKGKKLKSIRYFQQPNPSQNAPTINISQNKDFSENRDEEIIGHVYENKDYKIQWEFINSSEGTVKFTDSGRIKRFTWGKEGEKSILIYGEYRDVDTAGEIIANGEKLKMLDFSDGSEFIMTRIK